MRETRAIRDMKQKRKNFCDELSSQDDNDDNVDYTREMGEWNDERYRSVLGEEDEIRLALVVCNLKQFALKTGNNFCGLPWGENEMRNFARDSQWISTFWPFADKKLQQFL